MAKIKTKYINWFFQFLWSCIKDFVTSPTSCFNEIGLFKENWEDFKTRIHFDTDPELSEILNKTNNHDQ